MSKKLNWMAQKSGLEFPGTNMDLEGKIRRCQKCSQLGISNTSPHAFTGSSYKGTLLVGESPHRDWQSGVDPFMTPSGKRIREYLGILGMSEQDVILLEAAKCVVKDRKDLAKMINNCQDYLVEQFKKYDPKIVISLGKVVSDHLAKLSNVDLAPCNLYSLESFLYIPLFHPSPANPTGHKKNLEFLNQLMLNRELEKKWKK